MAGGIKLRRAVKAWGAALLAARDAGCDSRSEVVATAFLGAAAGDDDVLDACAAARVLARKCSDAPAEAAAALLRGHVVGW